MFEQLSPNTRLVLRLAAGFAIAIAAGFSTIILYFVGAVTATGCFIECSEPNVVGGAFLLAGAVLSAAVTVAAVVWGFIGWKRQTLTKVATGVGIFGLLVITLTLVAV
jgi:hypothetical protein